MIQRGLRRLTIATVVVYLALAGVGGAAWVSADHQRTELQRATESINGALCTLRSDLEARVTGARQFLADHPQGVAGISALVLKTSIDNQQRTIDALASLECAHSLTP
jgi:hypothetical protein